MRQAIPIRLGGFCAISLVTTTLCAYPSTVRGGARWSIDPESQQSDVIAGTQKTFVFNIVNSGDTQLKIDSVTPGCGCTGAHLLANVVPPGQRTEMLVVYSASNIKGSFRIQVVLHSDSDREPTKDVSVSGKVVDELKLNPGEAQVTLVPGEELTPIRITVSSSSGSRLSIHSIAVADEEAPNPNTASTVFVLDTVERRQDGSLSLVIDYRRPAADGIYLATARADMVDGGKDVALEIPLRLEVLPELSAYPEAVSINGQRDIVSYERRVMLKSNSGVALAIEGVQSSNKNITATYDQQPDRPVFVHIRITNTSELYGASSWVAVRIKVSGKDMAVKIPVTLTGP